MVASPFTGSFVPRALFFPLGLDSSVQLRMETGTAAAAASLCRAAAGRAGSTASFLSCRVSASYSHSISSRVSAPTPSPSPTAPMAVGPKVVLPTMADIMAASRAQGLHVRLRTVGPLFRVTATRGEGEELGRAEGGIRPWPGGAVLHLDSMRMTRATLSVSDRPLFGLGMFLGAVAVRHGFESGCKRAELLAINDTPLYHAKLIRFYTRMGFQAVHEVDGSSITDLAHMLVWGGRGTRMDANIEELLIKWGKRFRPQDQD